MPACGHTPIWSGQRTLRTNARGRHTYVAEFKDWIVEQAQQPDMSLAGLAMGNQVNANQLRRWVQLHGKRGEVPAVAARLLPVDHPTLEKRLLALASGPLPSPVLIGGRTPTR